MPRRHARHPGPLSPWRHVAQIFLTGLFTLLPIIVTLYVVLWVLSVLEQFFGRQVLFFIPDQWYRTGMGLAVAIVIVFLVGILMHGILFRRLFGRAEKLLLEIPLVRSVYAALRDLLGLFAEHKEPIQVVALELPMRLADIGMKESDLERAARIAVEAPYPNPRRVEYQPVLQLLRSAYEGRRPG